MHLFIRSSDNELKLNFFNGIQWSGWLGLGGELNVSPPSAVVYTGGSGQEVVDVFVRWKDDSIRYRRSDPNVQQGFGPWVNLGGAWSQAPVAVKVGANHNFVLAVHRGDKTLHVQRWKNGDWLRSNGDIRYGWRGLGGNVQSEPTAIAGAGNQVRVFARDTGQSVNMISWLGNDFYWENWVALDGDTVQAVATNIRSVSEQGSLIDAFGIDAATGMPFHTAINAGPPVVRLSMNQTAFTVGDPATYTVTGPPGAPIYWSSMKDGVSTGESYSFYGHYLDANGIFIAHAGEWPGSAIGSWVKYVHVGTQSVQTAQFAFTVSPRPVSVNIDSAVYQVGSYMTYVVTGPPNTPIYWSSWRNGVSTGEVTAYYGHNTGPDGRFTAAGVGPWEAGMEGSWIKQVHVGGQAAQVEFEVT